MITLTPAPLSTNHIYKTASRPFPRVYMTREGAALKESYQWQAKSQWKAPPMKDAVVLMVMIYYGDKRRRDIDNGNKILFDSLSGIVFEDDSQIVELTLVKRYDKDNPRVEVNIL